jgi:Spy/CpxP family protein refolding chaperone
LTHNPTSRRTVAGRFALLAAELLAAASLCLCFSPSAIAQHGNGGGGGGGARSMGSPGGGSSMAPRPTFTPNDRPTSRNLGRPNGEPRSNGQQPRMGLQLGLGGRWWDDHGTARKLSLNNDQQRRMDSIFEANKPTLINLYTNLQREESNLAGLSHADLQDEGKVFAAIDRVAHARSDLEKENAHYLLQMRQQLSPQQVQTLDHQIATTK